MSRRRFGATEAVILVEVLALVVYVAMPALRQAGIREQASRAANDIEQVRFAAKTLHARSGKWPEDGAPGRAPESLRALLPASFTFDRRDYQIDWDHWTLSDGPELFSKTSEFLAVSAVASDPRLSHEIVEAVGAKLPHMALGDRVTFVISDPEISTP